MLNFEDKIFIKNLWQCFQFLLGNSLNSLLAENLLHCHRFLIKILSSKFKGIS